MTAWYNEHDPYAAQWLRNLIAARLIAPGDVDERDIRDVTPQELARYDQCHFFAGIGTWSYALRLAGWPDARPVWTGSCPCQPFSAAGRGLGFADERHLWPVWFRLIAQCRPGVVFGEQVASRDGLDWLDLVHADLEGAGYAVGAVDLCAAGVGAPHIRQRLWFVAHAARTARERHAGGVPRAQAARSRPRHAHGRITDRPADGRATRRVLADAHLSERRAYAEGRPDVVHRENAGWPQAAGRSRMDREACLVAHPADQRCKRWRAGETCGGSDGGNGRDGDGGRNHGDRRNASRLEPERLFHARGVAHTDRRAGCEERPVTRGRTGRGGASGRSAGSVRGGDAHHRPRERCHDANASRMGHADESCTRARRPQRGRQFRRAGGHPRAGARHAPGAVNGFWQHADWIGCRDGRFRPVEPGTFPLAHGAAARMGRLRAYGNAIVATAAATFIEAADGALTQSTGMSSIDNKDSISSRSKVK
ncbi:DNA cytosine methyltransferase [Burkholderia multivorans]|uniref:DNA cytosine methyltransferase n=1 Tax=Burkholderia multivorans TaxID=87883 RepID=UPI001C24FBA9|nr:DNA cytosine methyltransferase [Burkholderia multivorans]MBU9363482.1 DNA cytosine methyltransferase [Burkholderia multivorans]